MIDRDAGEGRSVTVRGLGQDFTRVRINGIEGLATTGDTDSSGGTNRSRGFDFNVFAAELFNSLTARKSSSADIDEGSLGATVDLQTTRPFDLKGFNAAFSIKERYNDLSKKTNPRLAFMVSNTNAAKGTQPASVPNTTTSEIRIRPQGATNRTDVAKFDLIWDAIPDKLNFKAGIDLKKFAFDSYEFRRVNTGDTIFAPPAGTAPGSLVTTIDVFGRGQNLPAGTPTSWVIPNLSAIAQAYDIYCNCLKSGPAGGPGDFTLSSITNGNARGNNRSVGEKDNGAFLMGEFASDVG